MKSHAVFMMRWIQYVDENGSLNVCYCLSVVELMKSSNLTIILCRVLSSRFPSLVTRMLPPGCTTNDKSSFPSTDATSNSTQLRT